MPALSGKEDHTRRVPLRQMVQTLLRRRSIQVLLLATLCVAILSGLTRGTAYSISDKINAVIPSIYDASQAPLVPARHVHLVIPANHADANLCKTLLTSMILGYPTATIINWQVDFHVAGQAAGGSHLGKLFGINNWLQGLPEISKNDLVIVTDAYDVWFQLRPEVLVERYFDTIRRADERLRSELGQATVHEYGIDNTIVFSTQKKCGFQNYTYPYCDLWPQSTLPKDVFGDMTDVRQPELDNPDIYLRPRTLCSGTFIGRVDPLRKLFAKAAQVAQDDPNNGSDQRTLTYLFGEQEIWRNALRLDRKATTDRVFNETGDWEFGITLDYESAIGKPTVGSEFDLDFVVLGNDTQINYLSAQRSVTTARLLGKAADIERSRLPFAGLQIDDEELPKTEWNQVSLFTDIYSGFTPAIIHHNAWRNNSKSRRTLWWDRPWYHPVLRPLLDAASRARNESALVTITDRGEEVDYRRLAVLADGTSPSGLGAVSDQGEYLSWGSLCDSYDDLVFQDDKGRWRDPE